MSIYTSVESNAVLCLSCYLCSCVEGCLVELLSFYSAEGFLLGGGL